MKVSPSERVTTALRGERKRDQAGLGQPTGSRRGHPGPRRRSRPGQDHSAPKCLGHAEASTVEVVPVEQIDIRNAARTRLLAEAAGHAGAPLPGRAGRKAITGAAARRTETEASSQGRARGRVGTSSADAARAGRGPWWPRQARCNAKSAPDQQVTAAPRSVLRWPTVGALGRGGRRQMIAETPTAVADTELQFHQLSPATT